MNVRASDFESLHLQSIEPLIWTASAVTYHRQVTAKMALTPKGFYLNSFGRLRSNKWFYFDYSEVKTVTIKDSGFFGFFCIFSGINPFRQGSPGRTEIAVQTIGRGTYSFKTFPDCYLEERVNDRRLIADMADVLGEQGLIVVSEI